jgi:hypothetical protein
MKTITIAACMAAVLLLAPSSSATLSANGAPNTAGAAAAATQGAQDFTLVNSTGVEIHALYISPHETDDWEEDVLGRDTLPSGESVQIKFSRAEKAALWDLRVEDKDGNAIVWENLNLLEISKVTLYYKDGESTAEVE